MTQTPKFKAPISILIAAALIAAGITGCKAPTPLATDTPTGSQNMAPETERASFRKALACLPDDAAMIAAHRGTDERWTDVAENSLGGIKALIAHGTPIAEIDVAGLKDRTLITFHDGVWDDISTGSGPISTARKSDLQTILLKSRAGQLTAERPPLFSDVLAAAKDKIYLEVDFKSSARYEDVIQAIRRANMTDQVMLIAYSSGQAAKLKQLAPDMLRSNPKDAPQKKHAVWLGYDISNKAEAAQLKSQGHFIIGRIGDPRRQPPLRILRQSADILVTDQAERHTGILGLKDVDRTAYHACLAR